MNELIQRIRLAWAILRGVVKVEDGKAVCARPHLEAEEAKIKKDRLRQLEGAADDLKVAVGFIGDAGKWDEYTKVLKASKQ